MLRTAVLMLLSLTLLPLALADQVHIFTADYNALNEEAVDGCHDTGPDGRHGLEICLPIPHGHTLVTLEVRDRTFLGAGYATYEFRDANGGVLGTGDFCHDANSRRVPNGATEVVVRLESPLGEEGLGTGCSILTPRAATVGRVTAVVMG